MKRVTSADPGTVEEPEQGDDNGTGENGSQNGGSTQGGTQNGGQSQGGDNGGGGGDDDENGLDNG